jgi:hypothetical protein
VRVGAGMPRAMHACMTAACMTGGRSHACSITAAAVPSTLHPLLSPPLMHCSPSGVMSVHARPPASSACVQQGSAWVSHTDARALCMRISRPHPRPRVNACLTQGVCNTPARTPSLMGGKRSARAQICAQEPGTWSISSQSVLPCCCRRVAAPRPVGPEPMIRTSTCASEEHG